MSSGRGYKDSSEDGLLGRATLCLPNYEQDIIAHVGDPGFESSIRRYFETAENNATERLIELKTKLRDASTHDFWTLCMEGLCDITGSQCGFVAKRMLVDDQDAMVEMPPLGEAGSCLMGVAFYLNNGRDVNKLYRDYRYHAYGSPCAHMKHDKVFIIPERMSEVIPNSPNALPWEQSEAFIGVPLFSEGKCFAHFGMIWSSEGAARLRLSWSYVEMMLHAVEDMILQRLLEGRGFAKAPLDNLAPSTRIIPLSAITASQSLKPYARSLSHELRTPMQGVVGMLDIMHSTVLDAIDNQRNEAVKGVFKELRNNIEMVQDSSKRAVEAADNVVHAYDLNMEMPDTPLGTDDEASLLKAERPSVQKLDSAIDVSSIDRKRPREDEPDDHPGPSTKRFADMNTKPKAQLLSSIDACTSVSLEEPGDISSCGYASCTGSPKVIPVTPIRPVAPISEMDSTLTPAHRHIRTRDFLHSLVSDAVKSYHPIQQSHIKTQDGLLTQIKTLGPHREVRQLDVELNIEAAVPETIVTEEHHLRFCLQKVIDNAMKFTESGKVTIAVKLSRRTQLLEISVIDTGCGMTADSKAQLFKPHFQEDASISRARDGLGLSLFNAKAQVRKSLGGDMTLVRSNVGGSMKGSEFLIRLPLSAAPDSMRPQSPLLGTPVPTRHSSPVPALKALDYHSHPTTTSSQILPRSVPTLRHNASSSTGKVSKKPAFNRELAKSVPLTILIAEDNHINRSILVGYLKKLGYSDDNLVLAVDGVEAVRLYQSSLQRPPGNRINSVLMDLWMPNMDGYEATRRILKMARDEGESLAVMAVTADITNESLEKAKQTGMTGFVSKPFKVIDLEHMILEHFGKASHVYV